MTPQQIQARVAQLTRASLRLHREIVQLQERCGRHGHAYEGEPGLSVLRCGRCNAPTGFSAEASHAAHFSAAVPLNRAQLS